MLKLINVDLEISFRIKKSISIDAQIAKFILFSVVQAGKTADKKRPQFRTLNLRAVNHIIIRLSCRYVDMKKKTPFVREQTSII